MPKRKHKALMTYEDRSFVRLVKYTIEGPQRLRITCDGDAILNEDGSVTGARGFTRWEQL